MHWLQRFAVLAVWFLLCGAAQGCSSNTSTLNTSTPTVVAKVTHPFTLDQLRTAEYTIQDMSGKLVKIRLVDGAGETPAARGPSEKVWLDEERVAFGDLNNDGAVDAALALDWLIGFNNVHQHLVLVLNREGEPQQVAHEALGSVAESALQRLSISNGEVAAEMLNRGPNDPRCCPSIPCTRVFQASDRSATGIVALPTPVPQIGSRRNPVPMREAYAFRQGASTYKVSVYQVETNAWKKVKAADKYAAPPPKDNDYLLVRLQVEYVQGSQDAPLRITEGDHKLYADNQFWGAPNPLAAYKPEPKLGGRDIFPGAKITGWLGAKHVPTDLMDEAVLVYDGIYFALE